MRYVKVIQGWCEVLYDFDGNPLACKFTQDDSKPVDRRALREEADGPQTPEQLEDDEVIEHVEDLEYIESKEKFFDLQMVQPVQQMSSAASEEPAK